MAQTSGHEQAAGETQEANADFANSEDAVLRYQTAIRDCLTDGGFPAYLQQDGGVVIDIPPGQDDAFQRVDSDCREQIPAPPSRPLTEAEVNAKYDLEVESAECLAAAGYPAFEFESREAWVAQWMVADGGDPDALAPDTAWSKLSPSEVEEAQRVCKMPTAQDIYERLNEG